MKLITHSSGDSHFCEVFTRRQKSWEPIGLASSQKKKKKKKLLEDSGTSLIGCLLLHFTSLSLFEWKIENHGII